MGIASAWVTSAYHSKFLAPVHYCNRLILILSHPGVGTLVLWIMVIAKWEAGGIYAVSSYRAFGESMWSSKSHAAICVSAISVKLRCLECYEESLSVPKLLGEYTEDYAYDGFDGQKLTILTWNWLVLGWGSRMLKAAFGHLRHIWEFPRNLRGLGFPQTPWESTYLLAWFWFCSNSDLGSLLWSLYPTPLPGSSFPAPAACTGPVPPPSPPFLGCGREGCPC